MDTANKASNAINDMLRNQQQHRPMKIGKIYSFKTWYKFRCAQKFIIRNGDEIIYHFIGDNDQWQKIDVEFIAKAEYLTFSDICCCDNNYIEFDESELIQQEI